MWTHWIGEACDMHPDPVSGCPITRLTSSVIVNNNIYCEQPYTSPCGDYIAMIRSPYADPRISNPDLWVIDIKRLKLKPLEMNISGLMVGTSSWSGWIYYISHDQSLMRVDLATQKKEVVLTEWSLPPNFILQSVTPNHEYMVGVQFTHRFTSEIIRIDLATGEIKVIFEHDEVLTHLQIDPGSGKDLLVQHNRGQRINHMHEGKNQHTKHTGATHFIIDMDGNNHRPLAIGEPYTISSSGHCAWLPGKNRIGVATHFNYDQTGGTLDGRYPKGNFFTVGPGDAHPTCFEAPEHRFNHVNVSKDGKYFLCDSYYKGIPGPIPLVVGNIQTGKYAMAVSNCGAQGGGPACSHPHAYFTADNKNIIYNADPFHLPHVWAARVTDKFYQGLE
jgi:hypothetical protein